MALFRIPEHVLHQRVADELVIVDLDQGQYYTLDAIGCRMLQLAERHDSVDGLVAELLGEYDTSAETLRDDVTALLGELGSHGLVQRV